MSNEVNCSTAEKEHQVYPSHTAETSTHTHTHREREEAESTPLSWAKTVQIRTKDSIWASSEWVNTGGCPLHNPEQPDIETRKKRMLLQQKKRTGKDEREDRKLNESGCWKTNRWASWICWFKQNNDLTTRRTTQIKEFVPLRWEVLKWAFSLSALLSWYALAVIYMVIQHRNTAHTMNI